MSVPPQGGSDLRSCVDPVVQVGIPCVNPSNVTVGSSSNVLLVKCIHSTLLDSAGLLPYSSRSSFVLCPCIFSPTKWSKRKLIAKEFDKALGIPEAV